MPDHEGLRRRRPLVATRRDGGTSSGPTILVPDEHGNDERIPATTTELAGLHHDRWHNIDHRYAQLLRLIWTTTLQLEQLTADLLAHATTDDPTPAGLGNCEACDHFCNPKRNPDDRLKAKLCPACHTDWTRKKTTLDYNDWLQLRRQLKGHTEGADGLNNRFQAVYGGNTG